MGLTAGWISKRASLTVADHEALAAAVPSVALVGLTGQVEALRQIKDESEVAAIREAIRFAERAFQMLRAGLREGESEKDAADALEGYLRRCGATAASFPPIVAVGVNSALPHARPTTTTRIGQDDFVLIDWGATGRPYKSDLTRVLVTGKVTPKFEAIYRTVLSAQRAWNRRDPTGREGPRNRRRSPLRDRGGRFRPFF